MTIRFSILIVGYRSLRFLSGCFESLLQNPSDDFEILFLDNDSPDREADFLECEFEHTAISVFRSSVNLLYAGGNNYLAKRARGRYLLFLNPDTIAEPSLIDSIESYLERGDIAAAQLELRTIDGERETEGCYIDRLGFIIHAPPLAMAAERQVIFSGRGAGLLVRREVFQAVGGFDDRFGMYFEETDLCWRIRLAGYEVDFIEGAVVTHLQSGSHLNRILDLREVRFLRNRIWSLFKNQGTSWLIVHLPLHVALCLALTVRCFMRPRMALTVLLGFTSGVLLLPRFLGDRWRIQGARRTSDALLLERGLIKSRYKYSFWRPRTKDEHPLERPENS